MKRIKFLVAAGLIAVIIGCQAAPLQTAVLPVAANQSHAVAVPVPAADSKRSRTILVLALLAGLVAAAIIISASDGDGAY